MKNRRLWKRYLKPKDLIYGVAVICIFVSTVLLFLDRSLFYGTLPVVFACGIYMNWFWLKRMQSWKLPGIQEKCLIVFYCFSICILSGLFLLSLFTNWVWR